MKEIVIKIDDKLHEQILGIPIYGGMRSGKTLLATFLRAIRNGKVLPKGHGSLKDASMLRENYHTIYNDDLGIFEDVVNIADIDLAETLVEADTREE